MLTQLLKKAQKSLPLTTKKTTKYLTTSIFSNPLYRSFSNFQIPKPNFEQYPHKYEHEIPADFNLATEHSVAHPPGFIMDGLQFTVKEFNQYTRCMGLPDLCQTAVDVYAEKLGKQPQELEPMTQVMVSSGAQGCLHHFITAQIKKGDHCVVVEPFYYPYDACLKQRGLDITYVSKTEETGEIDLEALDAAIRDDTRFILIDNPSLADGRVVQKTQLEGIAALVRKRPGLRVVSSEVAHWQTRQHDEHVSFAALDGMFERTITMFSPGFEFDCRGYRIGLAIGPVDDIMTIASYMAYSIYSVQTPAMVSSSLLTFLGDFRSF